ncbi:phage portal protein [Paenibacillus sp. SI8]|uniref:phage portal protein n=1 Tax=unclassified Paenibacillus TaxID=185978 RepID=UPI0034675453
MALFVTGAQYPPYNDIERLAKYERGRAFFDGKQAEMFDRASELLKGTPFSAQIQKLFIAVNIMDALITKPADLMVGEPPTYESGNPDDTEEQRALNRIVEENDITQLIHEIVIGSGIRGDAWIKTYYGDRQDVGETVALGLVAPKTAPEPIVEAVDASTVFPELTRGSRKRFKAINIAWVEWVTTTSIPGIAPFSLRKDDRVEEIPFLCVERHVPGFIVYERYRLYEAGVDSRFGVPVSTYSIGDKVATGRDDDVVETGTARLLIHHVPYKTVDSEWAGIGGIEKLESVLLAISDRLVQIDYILWKHSDPTAYGPELDREADGSIRTGGKYIPVSKEDATPGYMEWNGQLEAAFKELDILLGLVYQISETPQWLFGTTLAEDKGGSGTSHTDGAAIKARFMPILSKVKRIRVHVDRAIRDALWTAMELENYANEGVDGFTPYEPVYPKINWKDGIPRDEKAEAEVYQIRTGNKPTIDVKSAIKRMDGVDDDKAAEIESRISDDEKAAGFVDGTVFNSGGGA